MAVEKVASVNKVEKAHQMYRDGEYEDALELYTEALSIAKTRVHRIALHSNRAACYLKLHHFKKAADECTSVLQLDNKHTRALMLRAQTLVALKEYHSTLFDVNHLLDINPSSEVYMELQARLKTQLEKKLKSCLKFVLETWNEGVYNKAHTSSTSPPRLSSILCEVDGKSLAPIPELEVEEEEEEEEECIWKESKEGNELKLVEEAKPIDHEFCNSNRGSAPSNASSTNGTVAPQVEYKKESSENQNKGWQAIPKPKGHSQVDYSRWNIVEDNSSDDDEDEDNDDEDTRPQFRFRVKA